MGNYLKLLPAPAVNGIATGLMLMTFFTLIWTGIAFQGLSHTSYWFILFIFPLLCMVFVYYGIRLFCLAKYAPKLTLPEDIAAGKKHGMWFGIIFGAEGLGIFIAINIVVNLGHPELTIPVIALVVGLHFYPLAKLFKRSLDYYLATWSTLIAIFAIILTLNKTLNESGTFAFTGIGLALATTCYGTYMTIHARKVIASGIGN